MKSLKSVLRDAYDMEALIARMPEPRRSVCLAAYRRGRSDMQASNYIADENSRCLPGEEVPELLLDSIAEREGRFGQPVQAGNLWERSGLEVRERRWTVEALAGKKGKEEALNGARGILAGDLTGLYTFYGGFGRGKSGILKSIVAECIRRGIPAMYVNGNRVLAEVRSTMGPESVSSEVRVFDKYASRRVLAIDEFDIIPGTEFAASEMRMLLDARCSKRETHLTLLATNADPGQMPDCWRYMESRMHERPGGIYKVGGDDLRDMRQLRLAGE